MKRLLLALEVSALKIIVYRFILKSKSVFIYRNVACSVSGSSVVSGDGQLHLGCKWESLRYMPSEFSLAKNAKVNVSGNFRVYTGFHLSVNESASLSIGSGYINNNSTIDCFEEINIGNNVVISKGVTIRDSDNHSINHSKIISAPITIEDDVWVGLNVIVLKGVTIGKGSVIAAGSVVTRSVPANCLAAGVPARVIKKDVTWE